MWWKGSPRVFYLSHLTWKDMQAIVNVPITVIEAIDLYVGQCSCYILNLFKVSGKWPCLRDNKVNNLIQEYKRQNTLYVHILHRFKLCTSNTIMFSKKWMIKVAPTLLKSMGILQKCDFFWLTWSHVWAVYFAMAQHFFMGSVANDSQEHQESWFCQFWSPSGPNFFLHPFF